MPKREKTPEPTDDEPKFLAIHYPYPTHANLENSADTKTLGRWLGSIIAPQHLLALHHKPSASNMIIVEIDRSRPHEEWRSLLGMHRWSSFLVSPTDDEKNKVSRVYFCQHNTGRQVQKAGWKRIDFDDAWFIPESMISKDKRPRYHEDQWETLKKKANIFKDPYPLSEFCELPTEDPTNLGLARNLPVQYFPREKPLPTPKTVVGSGQWVDTKLNPGSAWAKGKLNSTQTPNVPSPRRATPNEPRGRTPAKFVPSGVPMAPPGLPAPAVPSLPPGLTRAATTTDSSSSSDIDYLETQTAVLHISEESTVHDVAIEGLDCLHDLDTAHAYQPTIPLDGIVDSLWDDPPPKSQANIVICDEHAVVCSKGVCTVYSAQIRAIERQNGTAKRGRGRGGGGGAPPNRGRNGAGTHVKAVMPRKNAAPATRGGGGAGKAPKGRADASKKDTDGFQVAAGKAKGDGGAVDWSNGWTSAPPTGSNKPEGSDAGSWGKAPKSVTAAESNSWESASLGPW